ncbi:MAG: hypothetical protein ACXV7J_14785 [Methylomonas sp.]
MTVLFRLVKAERLKKREAKSGYETVEGRFGNALFEHKDIFK